ncbi:hypothetical protein ISS03_05050 [Patescibacteria group bacterium]|nr:hypothetical protein [Patescibacteria group bacterium]
MHKLYCDFVPVARNDPVGAIQLTLHMDPITYNLDILQKIFLEEKSANAKLALRELTIFYLERCNSIDFYWQAAVKHQDLEIKEFAFNQLLSDAIETQNVPTIFNVLNNAAHPYIIEKARKALIKTGADSSVKLTSTPKLKIKIASKTNQTLDSLPFSQILKHDGFFIYNETLDLTWARLKRMSIYDISFTELVFAQFIHNCLKRELARNFLWHKHLKYTLESFRIKHKCNLGLMVFNGMN